LIIKNNTVVVSKMRVFASYACLLNPLITWIPNFKPMLCTFLATSVNPFPSLDEVHLSGSGIILPHSSMTSNPRESG
jgi:hypothetical protein